MLKYFCFSLKAGPELPMYSAITAISFINLQYSEEIDDIFKESRKLTAVSNSG